MEKNLPNGNSEESLKDFSQCQELAKVKAYIIRMATPQWTITRINIERNRVKNGVWKVLLPLGKKNL